MTKPVINVDDAYDQSFSEVEKAMKRLNRALLDHDAKPQKMWGDVGDLDRVKRHLQELVEGLQSYGR